MYTILNQDASIAYQTDDKDKFWKMFHYFEAFQAEDRVDRMIKVFEEGMGK